jgi:hypothetical protein
MEQLAYPAVCITLYGFTNISYAFTKPMCALCSHAVRNESRNNKQPATSPDYQMKTIMAVHGKTVRDKIRSDQLRQLSGIQDIIKWDNVRRKEWDGHVERMEVNRLAKIAAHNRPQGVRSQGRPKKQWTERLNAAPST